jgi:hypothetical protein
VIQNLRRALDEGREMNYILIKRDVRWQVEDPIKTDLGFI